MRTTLALLLTLTVAHAAPRNDRGHTVGISFSPLHLVFPVGELQVEVFLSERFTLAVIGGFGRVTAELSDGSEADFDVVELGGQFRWYFYGGAEEGAVLGAELLYAKVDGEVDDVRGVGDGLAPGIFAGYKWTWDNFFIDLNGGVSFISVEAEASDGDETETREETEVGPLVNFNLGWSF